MSLINDPTIQRVIEEQLGFITQEDLPEMLILVPDMKVLIRTGANRYTCRLDEVEKSVGKIEAAGDYVRDVSIPVDNYDALKRGARYLTTEGLTAKY